jgi:peroxiredoxin
VAGLLSIARAVTPGDTIKNFALKDFDGKTHELYKLNDKRAIVFMVQGNGCPIVRLAVPPLRDVRDQYQKLGVEFFLLNTNLQDTPNAVKAESTEFGFNFPIWMDRDQKIGEALGITRTAEVFVVDPKTWKLMYHGPIDDRLSYEKQHPVQHHYLTDALDAMLAGKPISAAAVNSPGCLINFPNRSQIL